MAEVEKPTFIWHKFHSCHNNRIHEETKMQERHVIYVHEPILQFVCFIKGSCHSFTAFKKYGKDIWRKVCFEMSL